MLIFSITQDAFAVGVLSGETNLPAPVKTTVDFPAQYMPDEFAL